MIDSGACAIRTGGEVPAPGNHADPRAPKRGIDDAILGMAADAVTDGSVRVPDVRTAAFLLAGAPNWPARFSRADGAPSPREIAAAMVDPPGAGLAATLPPTEAA